MLVLSVSWVSSRGIQKLTFGQTKTTEDHSLYIYVWLFSYTIAQYSRIWSYFLFPAFLPKPGSPTTLSNFEMWGTHNNNNRLLIKMYELFTRLPKLPKHKKFFIELNFKDLWNYWLTKRKTPFTLLGAWLVCACPYYQVYLSLSWGKEKLLFHLSMYFFCTLI